MAILDTLLLAAGAGAVYYIMKPSKNADSVQELLDFKDIDPSGIIGFASGKTHDFNRGMITRERTVSV